MNIIFIGSPGAGKGTQAKRISGKYKIPHISTGDILRENIINDTELGRVAKSYMHNGQLVPDSNILIMIKERLKGKDCNNGFILDGFPRTIPQADGLELILKFENIHINQVVVLQTNDDIIVERLSSRRSCTHCGKIYNLLFNPPNNSGLCDVCDSKLIQRRDDLPETIQKRLAVYKKQTEPLVQYYQDKNLTKFVDGSGTVSQITNSIFQILDQYD